MKIAYLLVTCCLEESRANLLHEVILNLNQQAPHLREQLTVFDNASKFPGVVEELQQNFSNVYQSNVNVGYWSAIDWWLNHLSAGEDAPKYTYIIESDMIHYDFEKIQFCIEHLEKYDDVGSVRLHEYSIKNRHLYNKDVPHRDSRKGLWQSHTNKITGKQVTLTSVENNIWDTTFLTQLPALNRYEYLKKTFEILKQTQKFTELDFQKLYWDFFQKTAIIDGGIYHCNLNQFGSKNITGSWTSEAELRQLGYQATRYASITPTDQYIVKKL